MDSLAAAERVNAMWSDLGEKIAEQIPEILNSHNEPSMAIRWATCAEACFWKATGEADSHDVKDVLAPIIQSNAKDVTE